MKKVYTKHALDRMAQRGITKKMVDEAVEKGHSNVRDDQMIKYTFGSLLIIMKNIKAKKFKVISAIRTNGIRILEK